jgi:protein ImuB
MIRGMTRVEVETLPFITVIPRSRKEEAATERVLLECSRGFSPCVEDRSENDAFLCVIDVVGTEKLFGPPEALARDLLAHVRAVGVIACVAVSRNIHAASALAKGLSWRTSLKIISIGEEGTALASPPLTVLDLTEEQLELSLYGAFVHWECWQICLRKT